MKIYGTGKCLPERKVTDTDLEKELGLQHGWIMAHCGVKTRYYAKDELASELGAKAAEQALENAGLRAEDLDAVIGVSGVPQQAIPSMGALVHKRLGLKGQFAFDVNATCLSFLTGLEVANKMIDSGSRYVLLVSADIASVGLNPKDPKTATLFGDGAAAVIVGPGSKAPVSAFETWTEMQEACQFESGGTMLHMKRLPEDEKKRLYFYMDGPRLFKVAVPKAMKMAKDLLAKAKCKMDDLALVIPHQASPGALRLFEKKLKLSSSKFLNIVQDYGNMIATSLPLGLHHAIETKRLKRGDRFMMLGTSAGISVGGTVLEY